MQRVVLLLQLPISIVSERFSSTATLLVGVLFFCYWIMYVWILQ